MSAGDEAAAAADAAVARAPRGSTGAVSDMFLNALVSSEDLSLATRDGMVDVEHIFMSTHSSPLLE